ncbi:hypothetical protein [Amycolatopsis rifamycinica]|uniref:Uncharacterized protein n=1 Tax=Amycolatopsis rifamycinica TaxID=287986 RepID=A0A066TYN5_9PSEU|nr:hypothetical protein [Amycolatopsis rifamycinica]KDN19965.1 hypothetical protein DV20_22960 [Amycolatopsis rifamycinica]
MGIAIGLAGVLLVAAAAVLRRKARHRWVAVAASFAVMAGWALAAQFLLKPLVPGPVLAVIILGGLTLGILLAAFLGGRRGATPPPGASTSASSPRRPGRAPGPG